MRNVESNTTIAWFISLGILSMVESIDDSSRQENLRVKATNFEARNISCHEHIDGNENAHTSVREALVCLMVTLLLFVMVAQMEIDSPGTYPPLSRRTLQVTGPELQHVMPMLCSISQWNGCY